MRCSDSLPHQSNTNCAHTIAALRCVLQRQSRSWRGGLFEYNARLDLPPAWPAHVDSKNTHIVHD